MPLPDEAGGVLLQLARHAIATVLRLPALAPEHLPAALLQPGMCFVTLHDGEGCLRGCIGSLQPQRAMVDDVRHNALAAALYDPRFPPLTAAEWPTLQLEVSLLGAPQALPCASEAELIAQLQPGVDGVVLEAGMQRATFLPQVWAQLPQPTAFLAALKQKAGLPAAGWSSDWRWSRYAVQHWQGPAQEQAV